MEKYDAIVVGGGPTGLTTANLLGRYGITTLLVERNATTVQEPRAVSIDDESLRTMQACGAIDTVLERVVAGYGSEYYSPDGRPFLSVGPTGQPYGYPRRNAFRQPVLEAQLRDHLVSWSSVSTMFGWTVAAIDQDDTETTLRLTSADGESRIVKGRYVVAADGASSPIRTMLGLTLDGETFSEKWLIVDLENSPAPSRETMVFCDVRRPCIALPGPENTRRFEFKLVPGDDPARMTDDTVVDRLLAERGIADGSRVCRKTVYTFHARLASKWTKGRFFLAGDACHLTPPFAGQGMNSGIRDAHNIAWKLAAVIRLGLTPGLLSTYEDERRDHVRQMITLALRMGRIMGPRNRLIGRLTQSTFRLLGVWPAAKDYFAQMKYKPKPRFAKGLLVADRRPKRLTSVGRLLPQPKIVSRSGTMKLDDLLGDGFALLGFTQTADEMATATNATIYDDIKVKRLRVVAPGEPIGRVGCIEEVADDGQLRRLVDEADSRIFLIRPDKYVLAAFRVDEAERVARELGAVLGFDATQS